ncbi:hypothetical protein JHN59_08650 [Streptomyces sp. MBT49]|uniref:hypothetical protein n=1 Tax=unclassified Streptomyces TaxID=2593676 RepID=UPI00190D7AB2|nr:MULTISPECIES: hypothetical protein [unclassified Streptomyces]MBK3624916.1 hypothetical protein [Streptomyces sp. MBT49]MBK3632560.1 hypothetical protein [Streptomyces sp. MBT97]
MEPITFAWAPITKTEEQDDGTFMVYGPAASSHLDKDKQRLNADWLDKAMPAWFDSGANVREQHDAKKAAGVGVGLVKGDGDSGYMLASHIVDPGACLKVKHKVLKGYSVGIKNPKVTLGKADAPGGEIVGGDIIEVSIVDRPCNPTTTFEIAKADGAGSLASVDGALVVEKTEAAAFGIDEGVYAQLPDGVRAALASLATAGATVSTETAKAAAPEGLAVASPSFIVKVEGQPVPEALIEGIVAEAFARRRAELGLGSAGSRRARPGAALPDGSCEITSKADLRKALRAAGSAGDDVRRHIITRARALGLEGMVPEDVNPDTAETDDQAAAIATKAEEVLRDIRTLVPDLVKADDTEQAEETTEDEEAEGAEITSAQQAIACIARLIISQAEALAGGDLKKAYGIGLLMDSVRSLKWFHEREQCEKADLERSATGDLDKAATTGTGAEPAARTQTPAAAPAGEQTEALTMAGVAELVKAAVAEASKVQGERIEQLAGQLTKATDTIKGLPAPGGPVLTRTAAETQAARGSDADRLRAEARELTAKADACSDRDLRDGYLARSRELLTKADA